MNGTPWFGQFDNQGAVNTHRYGRLWKCVFFFQFEIRTVLEFQSGDGQARGTLQTTLGHPTVAPTNLI